MRQSTALLGMSLITLLGGHSDKEGAAARLLMASSERGGGCLPKAAAELAALVAMLYDGACISG